MPAVSGQTARGTVRIEKVTVPEEQAGRRVDRFLAGWFPSHSRSALQKLIRSGQVTVAGRAVRPSEELKGGETIEIRFPPPPPSTLTPQPLPLSIIHDDEDLLVIDKPAGLVVHPGAGCESGTLVHALIALEGNLSGLGGTKRPGIVHRLDRGTSGLLIVARNDKTHLALAEQFRTREVRKVYQALVWGAVRERSGMLDAAIGRNPAHRRKMSVRAPHGRPAVTEWKIMAQPPGFSLLEVSPRTGRTHTPGG
jgi:23S rRNA pseudouridine1911/1915/1917 synthase